MTHAELLARVSSAELSEWQAYLRIEAEEREARRAEHELAGRAEAGLKARKHRMRRS